MQKEKAGQDSKKPNRTALVSVGLAALVVILFVSVIIVYYCLLYSETRQKIIKSCELSAESSAEQINAYLSAGVHTIRLVSNLLDNMIKDGRSESEILDYLKNQSVAVINITDGQSPGVYGFINGEYLDGTGWVPDEDYVPTERPWYIAAMAEKGGVAVVDPYVDAETHTVMITISETLCDGKSVVAVDLSLDTLQGITKSLAENGETEMEIVLDRNCEVIAHSDKNEVGKSYLVSDGSFGAKIVERFRAADEHYFSLNYGGADYIVYTTPVASDWTCLSVFDATSVFRQLMNMLVFTIVSALFVASILLFIFSKYFRRIRITEELEEKNKEALAASEAKSNFLSNMSHEIRTPINSVLGMNEMILRESSEDKIIEYAQNVRTSGTTLLGLINDILDFSKIEAGKMEIIPVEYDISVMIIDLLKMISPKAEDKGLILSRDISSEIPRYLYGDEVRIRQVLTNILTNAVKYTETGSVTLRINCEKAKDEDDSVYLNCSVIDTGIGIKKEDMHKLFSEFERIEEKRNRNIEGTGLGMNITKQLLEMMGSFLMANSVYGKGSVFSFKLKQKVIKWDPLGDLEAAYQSSLSGRKQYREKFKAPEAVTLVVDDTEMNLAVFTSLLKETDIEIDTAESGEEALNRAAEKAYDIIFLDYMMPEMDGVETLHRMKDDKASPNADTVTVCLTADAISGAREKYLSEGFDDYLTKPIDPDRLEEVLLKYLPEEKVMKTGAGDEDPEQSGNKENMENKWYTGVPGLDVAAGLKNSGSEEAFLSLLKIYHDSFEAKYNEIWRLFDAEDWENYTIKVHALKSSSRIVGILKLGDDAEKMEMAGKGSDIDYIKNHHDALMESYRNTAGHLSYFDEVSDDRPLIPGDTLEDAYAALEEFALAMDYNTARMVMESINEYRLPPVDNERIKRINTKLSEMDWEGIKLILQERD